LEKARSPLTGIVYCLQCGAAVGGGRSEQSEREKKVVENDTGSEVDDSLIDT
jgi:hypothetical protein